MKVLVAGAGGVVGTRLVPQLVARGYEVIAMTRSSSKVADLAQIGAKPVTGDALNRANMVELIRREDPEVIVHELTALAGVKSLRRFDAEFALTNRLRVEGTDNLLAAARGTRVRRFIAQSYGNWNYARTGQQLKTEDDELDPAPPPRQTQTLNAIRHLESSVLGCNDVEGIVLRYGNFYGPGNAISEKGDVCQQVRKRRIPIIGDGSGVWSLVHIDDAASATTAAVERGEPGIYNVVDDEPVRAADWLPELARVLGAKPPRHVPVWLGRLAAGDVTVSMMTKIRGTSNAKIKREMGWTPQYPTYVEGFRHGLSDAEPTGLQSTWGVRPPAGQTERAQSDRLTAAIVTERSGAMRHIPTRRLDRRGSR